MQRLIRGDDASSISCDDGVDPVVIDITVEDLGPLSRTGKADRIAIPSALRESGNYYDILTCTFEPAMKRDHAIQIVNMIRIHVVTPQRRLIPTSTYEILAEAKMIHHRR